MHTWVSVRGCGVKSAERECTHECDQCGEMSVSVMVWWTQAKHMIMLKDSVMEDVLKFLDHCEGQQAISDPAS